MVVNSRECAPKAKNYNIGNVFMVEYSIVFVLLAWIISVYAVDNIVGICEGKRLCCKESVFGDFLTPFAKNTHIGISTSQKCEYQSGSLLI